MGVCEAYDTLGERDKREEERDKRERGKRERGNENVVVVYRER